MSKKNIVDEIIDSLLEQVLEKYPIDRVEEIKKRMNDFWDQIPNRNRLPYAKWGGPVVNMPQLPDNTSENDRELIAQLQSLLEHADWKDDFFPALSPGVRQVTIPSYFGCVEEFASASNKVKPVISNPKDVYDLPKAGFGPETPGGEMLERMRYWRKKTRGLLPIFEADLQGPFSVASQIWGVEEFLLAVYDFPDEVHHLLQLCTDAVIEYSGLMDEAVEGDLIPFHCMPAIWFPRGKGIAVSEDLAAIVSPQIVKEFVRPYLEQIADAFGGVYMHSCGSLNGVINELSRIKGLVGLNFSSCETDLHDAIQKVGDSIFLVVHNSPVNRTDLPLLKPIEHAELCGREFKNRKSGGLCIVIPCTAELNPATDALPIEKALSF